MGIYDLHGGRPGIYAQKFDDQGNKLGSELTVTGEAGYRDYPQVTELANGNLVFSWYEQRTLGRVDGEDTHLKYRILWDDLTKIDQYEGVQADETSFWSDETVLATDEYGHLGRSMAYKL